MLVLGDVLSKSALVYRTKTFCYYFDNRISYEETNTTAMKMAHSLRKFGVSKGDHVALLVSNSPTYLYIWFGLAKLGAVLVAVNTLFRGESLRRVLEDSDCRFLVVADEYIAYYKEIATEIADIELINLSSSGDDHQASTLIDAFRKAPPSLIEDIDVSETDPLIITCTSGTTGFPKLVRNCHRAYLKSAEDLALYTDLSEEDRIYTCLPLYHANPQVYCVLAALVVGGGFVLAERFSASNFWKDIQKFQCTAFSYVGAVLPILLARAESDDEKNSTIKKCFGGGAPKEVYDAVSERFKIEVLELYGMSETGVWNTINRPGRGRSGSIGQAREGFRIAIFDDNDNEVSEGQVGQIVIRPEKPFIMFDGYYNSPEETLKCSSNWWFHTGDLGKADDGFYYFCGRLKDSIRRGGENIAPQDIESVINRHPFVVESAAVGVEDAILQEEIKVAIVLKDGVDLSGEEVIDWCESRLPKFMVPRYVEFIKRLPKSASEKVQRAKVKEMGIDRGTWDRLSEGGVDKSKKSL